MTTEAMQARIAELETEINDLKDNADMSRGCFDMIRGTLAVYLPMEGCPPMMYNDAIRNLVSFMYWQGSTRATPPGDAASAEARYREFEQHRTNVIQAKAEKGETATMRDLAVDVPTEGTSNGD